MLSAFLQTVKSDFNTPLFQKLKRAKSIVSLENYQKLGCDIPISRLSLMPF
jgi:hypothetical protein